MKIGPYIAFVILCILYGSSYATATQGLKIFDGATLAFLRMAYSYLATFVILGAKLITNPVLRHSIRSDLKKGKIPVFKAIWCGIISFGLPHSLISISQRSISSSFINIMQSLPPFFTLIFSSLYKIDKITFSKLLPHFLAIVGTVFVAIPTFTSNTSDSSSSYLFDFVLCLLALVFFGYGPVYMKTTIGDVNMAANVFLQSIGSSLYAFSSAIVQDRKCLPSIFNSSIKDMTVPLIMGVIFTTSTGFLSVYVINELGPVISMMTNYGQIIVGVLEGVFLLNEWSGYTAYYKAISWVGTAILMSSLFLGMS